MCGLFGAIASRAFSLLDIDAISELGVVSSIRGIDSTGIATIQRAKKGKLEIKQRHAVTNPTSFMYAKDTQSIMKDKFLVMGHARAATIGHVNLANAHPIHEGRFIGCHNGSIQSHAPSKIDEDKLTDSRLLYRAMNGEGLIETLGKINTGAYALSFIDTYKRTMNFIRNNERPLFMMHTKGRTVTMWASEYRFLEMVSRGSSTVWDNPVFLEPFKLYQYDLSKNDLQLLTADFTDELQNKYYALPFIPSSKNAPSTMYCRICHCSMKLCACETPRFIRPFSYQISANGETFTPDAREDYKKPETLLPAKTTSVPGVYSQSALTPLAEFCPSCQKEKQFCFCDVRPVPLTPAKKDQLATSKRYSKFKTGEPHFIGYRRYEYTPAEAKSKLSTGCAECKAVCGLGVKSYWIDEDWYFCEDCHKDPEVNATLKGMSTWLGKFVYPENYNSETKH